MVRATDHASARSASRRPRRIDRGLTALLSVQAVTLFVIMPTGQLFHDSHRLLEIANATFALICVTMLSRDPVVRTVLFALVLLPVAAPMVSVQGRQPFVAGTVELHAIVSLTAFALDAAVTALVARHVFGPGEVTVHRVQGAVLLYLNAASLFAIAYGLLATYVPGAFAVTTAAAATTPLRDPASLSYLSLSTLTTTGYGDIVPVHPIARSLSNLESVFGQLFPATLIARIVALHLAHDRAGSSGTAR